jgi:uncharacterized RDD family membrane protein YckC
LIHSHRFSPRRQRSYFASLKKAPRQQKTRDEIPFWLSCSYNAVAGAGEAAIFIPPLSAFIFFMTDETLIIETPEHVELHFALASVGNRFLACVIDHTLQVLAITVLSTLVYNLSDGMRRWGTHVASGVEEGNLWMMALLILAVFLIFFGYFTFFETLWSGQTPGKRWMKLRVIQEDGRPIGFFAALTRNLLRTADMIPPPFYSLGILSIFASTHAKRLGDFVANTVVIKERAAEAPKFAEVFSGEIVDTALRRIATPVDFRGDLRLVTEPEIQVVESFLRRRYDIPEQPRSWLAWRIAAPLIERIQPEFTQSEFSYEGFLEEVLARYLVQRR